MAKSQLVSWAETWDRFLIKSTNQIKDYIQKEDEFLLSNIPKNSVILDAGCGNGRTVKLLAKIAKKIIGIDTDTEILEKAKCLTSNFKNVELFNENCIKTHFQDSYFDFCIFGMNTFGNLDKDKIPALKEVIRITKPNGRIFISVYSENALEERLKSYEKSFAGYEVVNEKKGAVKLYISYTYEKPMISEQFLEKDLLELCKKVKQTGVIIKPLNKISYICIVNIQK